MAKAALINHLCGYPCVFTKTVAPENLLYGFIHNGMVDKNTHMWPNYNKIIRTCRRNITEDELKLIVDTFDALYYNTMAYLRLVKYNITF